MFTYFIINGPVNYMHYIKCGVKIRMLLSIFYNNGQVNSHGVTAGVTCVVNGAVAAVGRDSVVHSLSSSGQSSKPSHQDEALIQMLLVGQRTVPGGQGLQMQPHEGVSTLCRCYSKEKLGSFATFFSSLVQRFTSRKRI